MRDAAHGSGNYVVRFDRNVRGCAYTGNVGLTGHEATTGDGSLTVVGSFDHSDGAFVTTFVADGTTTERAFHLTVDC